jgi:gamma-glutamylcyclotransferase (GGCT)/AIG2-like uncharacterized protein YtfP
MRRRCPGSEVVGRARLPDYRLGFTRYATKRKGGVADIVPEPGAQVWGALYNVDSAGMTSLDEFEGVPRAYRRIDVRVFDDAEVELEAIAYFANKTGEFAPARAYLGLIITGSRDHKLPDEYVQALENIRTHA